ncbi:uncharacterized protein [Arachis hypogaea]|uniref:uncharacterized protein n=1 Tax=Arachis hypogaea TaxID=3818 RepID=UPI0010FC608A|nr:uncharacterized protein LOC114927830 [Arachis hypogaea]
MPQVDLETLVSACAGGSTDRKITCESLAPADEDADAHIYPPEPHPDSPPESFWLSRDEEYDWWDRNAVYERKDSTKGNSNSNSNSTNLNPNFNANNTNSNSQRFSLNIKSKAAIIGLPKPQKPTFVDSKHRRNHKLGNSGLFPKRSSSVAKSESSLNEPSSPKVSCMGRVRSKRDRNRRLRNSRRSSSVAENEKPARTRKKLGFFESFRAIFRTGRRDKPDRKTGSFPGADSSAENSTVIEASSKARPRRSTGSMTDASFAESVTRNSVSEGEPPGLGGMMRFASGRRYESWVAVVLHVVFEVDLYAVYVSGLSMWFCNCHSDASGACGGSRACDSMSGIFRTCR